jgi:anaerobic selenocysteine-containing dehydrogenase
MGALSSTTRRGFLATSGATSAAALLAGPIGQPIAALAEQRGRVTRCTSCAWTARPFAEELLGDGRRLQGAGTGVPLT